MDEVLRFFKNNEIWVYVILSLAGFVYLRKFILAWDDLRGSAFGLERESAQSRLNNSAGMLVMLLGIGIAVFVAVSFIAPAIPGSSPLFTPTLDMLATPTTTLAAAAAEGEMAAEATPPTPTPTPPGVGCVYDQIIVSELTPDEQNPGIIILIGTADIPNFGFYKYEIARPGETVWLTIQAGRVPVIEGELGRWDTRSLENGEYNLRLVVTDNTGVELEPCVIPVRVENLPQP